MHHIFRENYNLVIKHFVLVCLRREQHYPSHIAVLYHLRVIRVKLCRTEKQPRAKFIRTYYTDLLWIILEIGITGLWILLLKKIMVIL